VAESTYVFVTKVVLPLVVENVPSTTAAFFESPHPSIHIAVNERRKIKRRIFRIQESLGRCNPKPAERSGETGGDG
jgi:hypothetical protein